MNRSADMIKSKEKKNGNSASPMLRIDFSNEASCRV